MMQSPIWHIATSSDERPALGPDVEVRYDLEQHGIGHDGATSAHDPESRQGLLVTAVSWASNSGCHRHPRGIAGWYDDLLASYEREKDGDGWVRWVRDHR